MSRRSADVATGDLFDPVAGAAERDRILVHVHARNHLPILVLLNAALEARAERTGQPVSSDDANRLLDSWGWPDSRQADRRFLGALWKRGRWRRVGYAPSQRVLNHARPIALWVRR